MIFEIAFIGVTLYLALLLVWERRLHMKREQILLSAALSKDVSDFVHAVGALRRDPKQTLKEMELENQLVLEANKTDQLASDRFPVN